MIVLVDQREPPKITRSPKGEVVLIRLVASWALRPAKEHGIIQVNLAQAPNLQLFFLTEFKTNQQKSSVKLF